MEEGEGRPLDGGADTESSAADPWTDPSWATSADDAATELAGDQDERRPWFGAPVEADRPPVDVCRFLAAETADGALGPAIPAVDAANRCVALGDAVPQSAGQQELICLVGAHRNCPRYLRGVLLESTPPAPPRREPVSATVIAAALVLVGAIAATFGFLAVRGGFGVELKSPSPRASSVAARPSAAATPAVTPSLGPSASLEPSPSLSPSPSPTPTLAPTPTPARPTPTPRPSSDRFAVLTKCPSTPDCWIYVVRAGDNLFSIAHWFGVSLDRIYEMNPWARTNGLRAGQQLRIPTPTR